MKHGISDSSPKKRGRPKKNTELSDSELDAEIERITSKVMDEDDPMGLSTEINQTVKVDNISKTKAPNFKAEKVEVAQNLNQFQNMMGYCRMNGLKEMEVSPDILRYFLKEKYDPNSGFMIYENIFLFESGRTDEVKTRLNMKMEEKLFGKS